ncbi:MAG: CsgG/HfaB family protein [Planctomycetota bacterium]|jgi:curli biogenesis system outer membrane secretion channel CsgG
MKKITVLVLFLSAVCISFGVNTQTRRVKGVAATREQAIKKALHEAVGQVQGVLVTSGIASSAASVGSIDVTREEVDKSIEMEGISVRSQDSITLTMAEGLVKSYEVIDESKTNDGKYEVTVEVLVYDYQSPLATTKLSLAVSPFEVQTKAHVFGDITVSSAELTKQFSQRLTTLLRDSGRFDLLDRDYDKAFRDEINLIKSGDTDLEQKARLKQLQGADYLLAGRIRRAEIITELKDIPTTGIRSAEYRGHFVGEIRLLVPATRQVAFSHEYRIKLETPEIKSLADEWRRDERDFDQIKDAFLDLAARQIIEDLLNDLDPVRIAMVDKNAIILDQGGQRMKPDAVYEVFVKGKPVVDPKTQEMLGSAERKAATLKITRILPRFSYAKIVDGKVEDIEIGQVCRVRPGSMDLKVEVEGGMKSTIERSPSGGVKMPFDN